MKEAIHGALQVSPTLSSTVLLQTGISAYSLSVRVQRMMGASSTVFAKNASLQQHPFN